MVLVRELVTELLTEGAVGTILALRCRYGRSGSMEIGGLRLAEVGRITANILLLRDSGGLR